MAVSIHQAAANAAVAYLSSQLPNDIKVSSRWPTADFPGRAITLITAGSRRDQSYPPRILSNTPQENSKTTKTVWQIAECTQPFQLDVWATSHDMRDDMIARLDVILRAGYTALGQPSANPVEGFFAVAVRDGWDDLGETTAQFSFDEVDYEDSSESMTRSQYRATYRGTAWMNLAIATNSIRQVQINLRDLLDGNVEVSSIATELPL